MRGLEPRGQVCFYRDSDDRCRDNRFTTLIRLCVVSP